MLNPGHRSLKNQIPDWGEIRSRLSDWLDSVKQNTPISLTIDWLVGCDYPRSYEYAWLEDTLTTHADCAPIRKLTRAILQQAISDRADRIEFRLGIPDFELVTCETVDQYEERIEVERPLSKGATGRDFAKFLAEAGVRQDPDRELLDRRIRLTVIFYFGDVAKPAMTIPGSLTLPLIRCYQYTFNYKGATTIIRPENLVFLKVRQEAAFLSIDHYDRSSDYPVGIIIQRQYP